MNQGLDGSFLGMNIFCRRRAEFLCALLLGCLLPSPAFSKDIAVTSVKVAGNEAEVTINDALVVKEIKVSREGGLSLKFPEFVARSGNVFPQLKVLSKQADEAIKKAIQTEQSVSSALEWDLKKDLKITELRKSPTKPTDFFGMVSFGDAIEVSVRFVKEKGTVKLRWPARPPEAQGGKWTNQIEFKRRGQREIAEPGLIDLFLIKEKELSGKGPGGETEKKGKKPQGKADSAYDE